MNLEHRYAYEPAEWDGELWCRHYRNVFFGARLGRDLGWSWQRSHYDGLPRWKVCAGVVMLWFGKNHGHEYAETQVGGPPA